MYVGTSYCYCMGRMYKPQYTYLEGYAAQYTFRIRYRTKLWEGEPIDHFMTKL